ncbi:MAG: hypothetical protein AAF206_04760 [Bacteroidota bacterium]
MFQSILWVWLALPVCPSQPLQPQLAADYDSLCAHSEEMSLYRVSKPIFQYLFEEGLAKAEAFCRQFAPDADARLDALQQDLHPETFIHPGRPAQPIVPTEADAIQALQSFSGSWYGYWRDDLVSHHWLRVQKPNVRHDGLIAWQTCFTGDGFGWNYVVKMDGKICVLGYVFHFDAEGIFTKGRPHFAQLTEQGQILWFTEDHIYCEKVCQEKGCESAEHYVITGGQFSGKAKYLSINKVFQAIYLRNNQDLPLYQSMPQ